MNYNINDFYIDFKISKNSQEFINKYKLSLFSKLFENINTYKQTLKKFKISKIILFDEEYKTLDSIPDNNNSDLILHLFPMFKEINIFKFECKLDDSINPLKFNNNYYLIKINYIILRNNIFKDMYFLNYLKYDLTKNNIHFMSKTELELKKLANYITKYYSKEYMQNNKSLNENHKCLLELQNDYNYTMIRNKNLKKKIQDFEKLNQFLNKKLYQNLKLIKQKSFLKDFNYDESTNIITFDFGKIYIKHKIQDGIKIINNFKIPNMVTKNFYIGKIKIIIEDNYFKCINYESKDYLKNLNKEFNYYNSHPHSHSDDNTICFGEIKNEIHELLTEFKFDEISNLLYSWVISYNSKDPYLKIENWYTKEEFEEKNE